MTATMMAPVETPVPDTLSRFAEIAEKLAEVRAEEPGLADAHDNLRRALADECLGRPRPAAEVKRLRESASRVELLPHIVSGLEEQLAESAESWKLAEVEALGEEQRRLGELSAEAHERVQVARAALAEAEGDAMEATSRYHSAAGKWQRLSSLKGPALIEHLTRIASRGTSSPPDAV